MVEMSFKNKIQLFQSAMITSKINAWKFYARKIKYFASKHQKEMSES